MKIINSTRKDSVFALWILIFAALILIWGCAQFDGDTGKGIASPGFTGEVVDTIIVPELYDTYYGKQLTTGGVQYLYLGEHSGFQAKFLLKFSNFNSLPDSFQLDSVSLYLRTLNFFGDSGATYADFNFSVHEVLEVTPSNDWVETNVTWDSVLSWDPASIFDGTISQAPDSDSISISIPAELVENWILAEQPLDTTGGDTIEVPNTGLIFDYSASPEFARQFFSSEWADTTLKPHLLLYITTSDSAWLDSTGIDSNYTGGETTVEVRAYATDDVYICRDTAVLPSTMLYLGRGIAYRCIYHFDVTPYFPTFGNYIHKAQFTLFFDSNSPLAVGDYVACSASKLDSDSWMSDSTQAEYVSIYSLSSSIAGDSVVLDITPFLRTWVVYPDSNFGLISRFSNETATMARLPVFNSENAPEDKQPYLRVIFSREAQ